MFACLKLQKTSSVNAAVDTVINIEFIYEAGHEEIQRGSCCVSTSIYRVRYRGGGRSHFADQAFAFLEWKLTLWVKLVSRIFCFKNKQITLCFPAFIWTFSVDFCMYRYEKDFYFGKCKMQKILDSTFRFFFFEIVIQKLKRMWSSGWGFKFVFLSSFMNIFVLKGHYTWSVYWKLYTLSESHISIN